METGFSFCGLLSQINWLWYVISVIVVFAAGGVWFSILFSKAWIRIFKIEIPEKVQTSNTVITMLAQVVVSALFGFLFFVLTPISIWLSILTLIAFCGWQKGNLKFRYTKWNEYFTAALIEAGYTFVAGMIFILFALI